MFLPLSQAAIRNLRPEDAASATRHISSVSVVRNMSAIPHPYTLRDAEEWIAFATSQTPPRNFAITIDDTVVGGIGLVFGEPGRPTFSGHSAEIGYWLGEPFWGRGIMTEAVTAFTEWAFTELRLVRLHAAVYARNPASTRVLEKAGYTFEGRLRARYFRDDEYIDGLLYAKVRLPTE